MRRLVVLRPEPGASATVERALERGLDAFAVPLFEVEPVPWRPPDASAFDALLLTSANAMRHGGEALQDLRALPVHAVGEQTAQAARDAGFQVASAGTGGADALLEMLAPGIRLLHLCAEDRHAPAAAAQRITPLVVYRATAREAPGIGSAQGCVALVHSPRAGERLAELVSERGSIVLAAISPAAVQAAGAGWERVETATRPTDDALLALAERLCDNP